MLEVFFYLRSGKQKKYKCLLAIYLVLLQFPAARMSSGGVAEWFNAPVLKTDVGLHPP